MGKSTGTMTATFEPSLDVWNLLAGEPTEYIVVNPTVLEVRFKDGEVRRYPQDIRERIVRCEDCRHSRHGGWECWRFVDDPDEDFERIACASPEGFCAWGERREEC